MPRVLDRVPGLVRGDAERCQRTASVNAFAQAKQPDGLFYAWETMRSGRLRFVVREGQGIMELEGAADLVLEIVSKSSVRKDTVLLRDLYFKAGISEYWLVDVRDGALSFDILQRTPEGYVPALAVDGWVASKVLGKKFQLQKR